MLLPLSPALLLSLVSASCHLLGVHSTPILNGDHISAEQSPWNIQINLHGSESLHCSGSVVSNYHILTAAHCHRPAAELYVLAGSVNTDGSDAEDLIDVVRSEAHPQYVARSPNYDVAMMTLSRDIVLSSKVRPIAWNQDPNVPQIGDQLQLVGNGEMNMDHQKPFDRQSIVAYATSSEQCLAAYLFSVCMEYTNDLTACAGDSGTGVVMDGQLLVAVYSSGQQYCGESYAIAVRTSHVADWIWSIINEMGPPQSYK